MLKTISVPKMSYIIVHVLYYLYPRVKSFLLMQCKQLLETAHLIFVTPY